MKKGAELVAEDARERVEIGPPPEHIKDHIEVARHEAAGYYVAATATDEKGRPYAHWHEFGTTKTPPYPFLVPALEANAHEIEGLAKASLQRL
jgi:HK97 gp10 family phage protein